jgi:CHRD domain
MKRLLLLFVLLAALALPSAEAQVQLSGTLSGSQEVPAFATNATGTFEGIFDPWSKTIAFRVDFSGFTTNVVAAHFHAAATGVNGPVTLDLAPQGFPIGGTSGAFVKVLTLSDAQAKDLIEGRMYINIHTQLKQSGEIRGQINYGKRPPNQPVQVRGVFSGDQEVPAVQTTATGKFDGIFDPGSRKLAFRIDFSGLTTNTVSAHFHTGAAGVGGPVTGQKPRRGQTLFQHPFRPFSARRDPRATELRPSGFGSTGKSDGHPRRCAGNALRDDTRQRHP